MRIRNVPPYIIVPGMIEAHKAGLQNITRDELEAHYLAGGHVERVVHALVSASKANIELPFQMATAIDLAGRDVFEAVQMSVNPKVIDTSRDSCCQRRYPADCQGPCNGARQYPPIGGRCRRRHDSGPCRRRVLCLPSVRQRIISLYWRIRILSPNWYCARVGCRNSILKFCPLTLLILT